MILHVNERDVRKEGNSQDIPTILLDLGAVFLSAFAFFDTTVSIPKEKTTDKGKILAEIVKYIDQTAILLRLIKNNILYYPDGIFNSIKRTEKQPIF